MPALSFVFDPSIVPPPPSNLEVALHWGRLGIPVFPCREDGPDQKRPYGIPWRLQSTTNEQRIRQWWLTFPGALPGIDLAKTRYMAMDLDGAGGALDWREISEGQDPGPPASDTPNGGRHVFYQRPDDSYGNGRGDLPPKRGHEGIDVRGHGGYVIAPGARLPDSRTYEPDGDLFDAPPLPDWLKRILKPDRPVKLNGHSFDAHRIRSVSPLDDRNRLYGQAALDREAEIVRTAPHGGRNESLNKAAFACGQLIAGGCLTESEVRSRLVSASESCGLVQNDGIRSVQATILSGLKSGAREPRGPPEDQVDERTERGAEIVRGLSPALVRETDQAPEAVLEDTELPTALVAIPGLLGDITEWICNTARQPQPALALGAALTVIGTAAGRHLAGPTHSGTHLYVIGLAPTGAGKDHPLQQIATLLTAASMGGHIGPSQFISMPAVINFLVRSPLSVCAMDEFGAFMKRINNRRASGFESAISGILRTAWGTSFKPMTTPEWAGKPSDTIVAPALSIYGVSTAEDFYEAMAGGDTSNGVLNRLLIFQTDKYVTEREPIADPFQVPASIQEGIKAVYERQGILVTGQLNRHDKGPSFHVAAWGAGASEVYAQLRTDVRLRCHGDAQMRAISARTAEIAVRMATIRAVGEDPAHPIVTQAAMEWAAQVALWASKAMKRGAQDYIADSDNQSAANLVRRTIQQQEGRMKHRDLLRKLNHKIKDRDLKDIIRSLAEAEQISVQKVIPEGGGTPSIWYTIVPQNSP